MYNLFIRLYYLGIASVSPWNKKAKEWINGRKNWSEHLSKQIREGDQYIWMHCSSAGEFEQGKPIAEALKKNYPSHKLLLTFFSPSGYSVAENYKTADIICYLPLDTKKNANRFIDSVKPQLVIFIKYEFWYHHLSIASFSQVPLLLTTAVFRQQQIFFKSYGGFFRQMLRLFHHIMVQDKSSLELLNSIGINQCSIAGDTRFDRVKEISSKANPVPFVESFLGNQKTIVAGSTWEGDEDLLKEFMASQHVTKLILVPHEIDQKHLQSLQTHFLGAVLYSNLQTGGNASNDAPVLIVDSVGLLSRLYQHATITYVGGGFTRDGVHNVLEAAVWGKPVIFGPNYKKYREAEELITAGGGFSIATNGELTKVIAELLADGQTAGTKAKRYIDENTGATERILGFIQANRLLTN